MQDARNNINMYILFCRYIVATQDRELQDSLRKIPGVPIIYLHGKAPTLEAPSQASSEYAENIRKGLGMTEWEKENIKTLKEAAGIVESTKLKLKKRRKRVDQILLVA
ncbi:rRNA-processing protein UTP23 homolog [Anthophora plagiata]